MRPIPTSRRPTPQNRLRPTRGARIERSTLGILRSDAPARFPSSRPRELNQRRAETIASLLTALQAKDPYTHDHSIRVAAHADRLASAMRLTAAQTRVVHAAALLHDIGKMGIPDAILNKPGCLSADEFTLMKRHSEIGATILQPISTLADEMTLVLRHHEWYDGNGYPGGLKGRAIPLGARIVHVADSLDAMLAPRSYRPGLDRQRVVAELERGLGRQFDPVVGNVALNWLRRVHDPASL